MNLSTRKNDYGHTVIDCPFCEGWVYLRSATPSTEDQLRDLKRHITTAAKNEAFEWMLENNVTTPPIPHLEYYRKHVSWKPQRNGTLKRQFDNDLSLV